MDGTGRRLGTAVLVSVCGYLHLAVGALVGLIAWTAVPDANPTTVSPDGLAGALALMAALCGACGAGMGVAAVPLGLGRWRGAAASAGFAAVAGFGSTIFLGLATLVLAGAWSSDGPEVLAAVALAATPPLSAVAAVLASLRAVAVCRRREVNGEPPPSW